MTLLESIRASLSLLDSRSRRILWLLVLVQVALAFLDMIGVLLFGVVAALSAAAISGEQPALITGLLERLGLSDQDEISLAITLAVVAGVIFVAKSIISFFLIRRAYRFLASRQAIVSSRLASSLLARPLLDVQRRSSQQTSYALVQGANAATLGVLGSAVVVAAEIAVLVVIFAGLLVVDPLVAVFTVVFFGLIGWTLLRILGRWAKRLGKELSATEIASITSVQNALRTYREVTVTGRRRLYVDKFRALRWDASRVQANMQVMGQVTKYVFEIALIIGGGLLAVSQFLTRDVVSAVAVIAVFLAAASRLMPSLLRLQAAFLTIRSSAGIAAPTLDLARELQEAPDSYELEPDLRARLVEGVTQGFPGFVASICVEDVTLTYPQADGPAVDGVTLTVRAGESLALVGPTGAGKSTIADLILGVLEPDQGSVSLSGVDAGTAIQRWPGAITYVPQDIAVLDGTIRDNVALGLPDDVVNDDLVWEALERSSLAAFIREERNGLDTTVGENGVRLSGGQRQRLGLARALYTQPRLLVLDEATSALDAETELAVSQALDHLGGDVTLVIIAHRLATIRHCTQIAYLEHGRILAYGAFDEVRAQQPNFDRQAALLGL